LRHLLKLSLDRLKPLLQRRIDCVLQLGHRFLEIADPVVKRFAPPSTSADFFLRPDQNRPDNGEHQPDWLLKKIRLDVSVPDVSEPLDDRLQPRKPALGDILPGSAHAANLHSLAHERSGTIVNEIGERCRQRNKTNEAR
jgi:hypothetical protein